MSEDHQESIFHTVLEGSSLWVQNSWRQLTIIHRVVAVVGYNLRDRDVCSGKSGIASAAGKRGAHNLTDIVGSPTSVEDICLGIGSVETDHRAGARATAARRDY